MVNEKPQYTLKIYDKSLSTLRHTITDEASIQTHLGMNDDLGNFDISLPAIKAYTAQYSDIVLGDYVKLWVGYDSSHATGDPTFMGRIYQTIGSLDQNTFYRKTLRGRGLNELLQRRIKSRTAWVNTDASDIVTTLATDLGLGTTYIDTDTTDVNLTIDQENYIDILKKVSDYWYSAGTQIKKDSWIEEVSGTLELIWASRPRRTAGVETIDQNTPILGYTCTKDLTNLKNAVGVYGNLPAFNISDETVLARKYPANGDDYTYGAYWTATVGAATSDSTSPKVGATCTHIRNVSSPYNIAAHCTFPASVCVEGLNGFTAIEFYGRRYSTGTGTIQLYAPDSSNYFEITGVSFSDSDSVWKLHRYSIGKNNEYNATTNPTGWTLNGSPSWEQITAINIVCSTVMVSGYVDIDGLCFNFGRWRYAPATDATSISVYDEFDLILNDNNLSSDEMCENRAQTYIYQYKDPTTRIDLAINGNSNILLGDKLSLTLAAEGINSQDFYVTGVDHAITDKGWKTKTTLLDTDSCRNIPSITTEEVLIKSVKNLQQMSRNIKRIN